MKNIPNIIHAAIAKRIFPGAIVFVAQGGEIVHAEAYGTTMYDDPGTQPVTLDMRYDVASLTKMFTTTAALRLYERGMLQLDALASSYLPGLQAYGVTIWHLLTHTSGLSLRLSLLRDLSPADIRDVIYLVNPMHAPGFRVAYVNINTLLLGDIVAQIYGKTLDVAIKELVTDPIGIPETCFCPDPVLQSITAPTEYDAEWRGKLVQGTVHDESAHALGGVAGHAGLFSTAHDIGQFMQAWLSRKNVYHGDTETQRETWGEEEKLGEWVSHRDGERGREKSDNVFLSPETIALATSVQTADCELPTTGIAFHCGLGWMMRHPIIMKNAPDDTYGHTGFTGPTMVAVPSRELCLVILSNRIYPKRGAPVYHEVTGAVLDEVLGVSA